MFSCEHTRAAAVRRQFEAERRIAQGEFISPVNGWKQGFPQGRSPVGKNWRDNVNYIRSFGYDEQ